MTKKKTKHGAIQKVYHLHNGIFHPMSHIVNFTLTLPLCYSLNVTKKLYRVREKKMFLYMAASAEVKNHNLRHN